VFVSFFQGGALLTLSGSNFGLTGTVTVGTPGIDCPVDATRRLHTQLVCTMPAGQGVNLAVIVKVSILLSDGLV
jgi:hypothetical protein